MAKLTSTALQAWEQRQPLMVLSTCVNNTPNTIWILCAKLINEEQIVIANNAMYKTLQNIEHGSRGSLLYIAPEREAYQIKGSLQYYTDGEIYKDMKKWLDPKFPGKGAVLLNIEEVFYGAEKVS